MSASSSRAPSSSPRRQSRITVEYHRPSRESIQEYNALLQEANLHAAQAQQYKDPLLPSRQAPTPPKASATYKPSPLSPSGASTFKPSPLTTSASAPSPPAAPKTLQKQRHRKHSLPNSPPQSASSEHAPQLPHISDTDPFAAKSPLGDLQHSIMSAGTVPPPRPSRANTGTLDGMFPTQQALAQRRLSVPATGSPSSHDSPFYQDAGEIAPSGSHTPPSAFTSPNPSASVFSFSSSGTNNQGGGLNRTRGGTGTTKGKKGFSFMPNFLNSSKRLEISTPYDPVHLTHVGFNSSTGEFTGLPKEWQQLLQESGISRSDQEKNPQAVMEIVKFYQEGRGEPWDKMGFGAVDQTFEQVRSHANPLQPSTQPHIAPGPATSCEEGIDDTDRFTLTIARPDVVPTRAGAARTHHGTRSLGVTAPPFQQDSEPD